MDSATQPVVKNADIFDDWFTEAVAAQIQTSRVITLDYIPSQWNVNFKTSVKAQINNIIITDQDSAVKVALEIGVGIWSGVRTMCAYSNIQAGGIYTGISIWGWVLFRDNFANDQPTSQVPFVLPFKNFTMEFRFSVPITIDDQVIALVY
jgi:hypothetical protein